MERNILQEKIQDLKAVMDRIFYMRNSGFAMIRALFLKYITDNYIGAQTKEDMEKYVMMQKIFAARDFVCDPNVLYLIFWIVEKEYSLEGVFEAAIPDYVQEIFGLEKTWNTSTTKERDARIIVGKLAEIDLTETGNDHIVGKTLVQELTKILSLADYRTVTGYVTGKAVATTAQKILQVGPGESFLDFASGLGTSTLTIIGDQPCKIINMDINRTSLALAAMLYIMYGYKDFHLDNCSYDSPKKDFEVDKIFVDPPFGVKMSDNMGITMDSVATAIEMATAYLDFSNPSGKAVVAANSGYLFGTSKNLCFLKQNLLGNGFLRAVIALPITVPGTAGVTVNLMILDTKKNEEVIFVNACSKAFSKYVTRGKGREPIISEEGIDKIAEIVNFGTKEDGISAIVSNDAIRKEGLDLMPSRYVKEPRGECEMTIEDIDNKLAALYAKLGIKDQK